MRLLVKILIAIVLGIGSGYIFPEWLSRAWATFNGLFAQLLGFLIPLLIVGFVAPAIAELGKRAGKMLAITALIAYVMTFVVGIGSYAAANAIFPAILDGKVLAPAEQADEVLATLPFFKMDIPPLMGVTSALVLAFSLGLGTAALKTTSLRDVLNDFRDIINLSIGKVIIPLLPFYIFGIFMNMTIIGQVGTILSTFASIVVVIFAMHIAILILQYLLASAFSGLSPFKSLKTMLPAYFTALGTQSSAATIPVTLRQTVACGVDSSIAGFVVPLCATIHMSGSTMKIVCCAVALMLLRDMPFDIGMFAEFIGMLAITIIAAPGVPGGAIMASLGLLSTILGFSEADCALMISLYIAMDSFGTACNITGDGAIAQIVEAIFHKK